MTPERYLLDTHILLWILTDAVKISPRHRELLARSPVLVISAVSVWEITIKKSIGKLKIADNFLEIIRQSDAELLSITSEHADAVATLPHIHGDPFDRLLVAQAICDDLPLMTVDRRLAPYGIVLA